jgi:hypothetical protein
MWEHALVKGINHTHYHKRTIKLQKAKKKDNQVNILILNIHLLISLKLVHTAYAPK